MKKIWAVMAVDKDDIICDIQQLVYAEETDARDEAKFMQSVEHGNKQWVHEEFDVQERTEYD